MRNLIALTILVLFGCKAAVAQSVTPVEYYKSAAWTMYQQYWKGVFDACVAEHDVLDEGRRFSIGRAITGEDFIMVHNMKSLFFEGTETLSGKVWINGKTPYDFSGVKPFDSVSVAGEKYVTIYLANGFVDQFAKALNVEIEFTNGRSKHSLRGSRDVITRLNECMDTGLNREMDAPVPTAPAMRTPLGWTAGASTSGNAERYIVTKLPPTPKNPVMFMALAETGPGRYDIRLRTIETDVPVRVDSAAADTKRAAVNILINGTPAFATLAMFRGDSLDIVDVPAADLMKLSVTGEMAIKPFDTSMPQDAFVLLNTDTTFGPAAVIASAIAPEAAPAIGPTLEKLVGIYYVRGKNPNGAYYYGTAETLMEGATLRINWKWTNDKTDTGIANMVQNLVTAVVPGLNSPAIYTIGKDGVWRGTWDNGKAVEFMVPKL
jgi:hypothetical protein